jgi:hypothetical protein
MADLTPISYVAGTLASIAGVLGGAAAYYSRQRKRWTDEGATAQKNTEAIQRNTDAAQDNTSAVRELSGKFDRFAEETRRELSNHHLELDDHQRRLARIEDVIEGPMRTRRLGDGQ